MSAPEGSAGVAGVRLAACATDTVEIAALPRGASALTHAAAARGVSLCAFGRIVAANDGFVLSVRPERWLILAPPAAPGAFPGPWEIAVRGCGAAVDLSAALSAFHLSGAAVREMLARGCRLDLDPELFAIGSAAATVVAQVSVTLAALPSGLLLLTPASTARHFREWLATTAKPFGLMPGPGVTVAHLREGRFS
ncbi:MAG: hypothetical protein JO361_05340 [Gammaproteobacteria bacterium]|nr:hypothetical protein [Gammaproteobacteria bacterium]